MLETSPANKQSRRNRPRVVDYLKTHSLNDLFSEHGVKARRDNDNTKVTLDYDQFAVRSGDALAEQCRGLILRPRGYGISAGGPSGTVIDPLVHPNWEDVHFGDSDVVAWPLNRFYNTGDPHAADVSWDDSGLTVFEKLDGTMTLLYWDEVKQAWHVGTRGVSEANISMNDDGLTFRQLFEVAVKETTGRGFDEFTASLAKSYTYVFELTAPHNRIVVRYDRPRVTLLACRSLETGDEIDCSSVTCVMNQGVPLCPRLSASSLSDLIALVNDKEPSELEGAVLCDSGFRRVKVKSVAYVLTSRMSDMLRGGSIGIIDAILDGAIDDVLPQVDAYVREKVERIIKSMIDYDHVIAGAYADMKRQVGDDRRAFAELVKTSGLWTAPLFAMNQGKATSFLDWAKNAPLRQSVCRAMRDLVVKGYET